VHNHRYTKQIRGAAPGIILVEEAGEILESHMLTAMTPSTKQLILIGDHQQLRPKVNNYALTVEKGEGYDLNRSLFERLIRAGIPHITLRQQHRMCPEISSFVRQLTYPDLIDAPSTLNRDPVKGIRDRVVFIDHREPELAASQVADRNDQGATVSRQNLWEASMILKVVRYMAQQGYGTAQQVVLTPYLGQLVLLREQLAIENDPVLNDLDSADLVKAGLMTQASASSTKGVIRLSTIGTLRVNYSVSPPISLLTSARQLSRRGKRHRHR
jgi:superfamily I DNA and/or RNA helicase